MFGLVFMTVRQVFRWGRGSSLNFSWWATLSYISVHLNEVRMRHSSEPVIYGVAVTKSVLGRLGSLSCFSLVWLTLSNCKELRPKLLLIIQTLKNINNQNSYICNPQKSGTKKNGKINNLKFFCFLNRKFVSLIFNL